LAVLVAVVVAVEMPIRQAQLRLMAALVLVEI
jgi:hypothetical protein